MRNLISRQAFLDFIESVPFLLEHQNLKAIVIDWIKQQPTAYDVDKVVEQLEDRSKEYNSGVRLRGKPEEIITNEAIEIVKGGGRD